MNETPPDGTYTLDPAATELRFRAKGMGVIPATGTMPALEGEVRIADGRMTAHGTADATKLKTGIPPRDMHTKHKHFMYVKEYPTVELRVDDTVAPTVTAQLTVRGNTVDVPLTLRGLRVENGVLRCVAEGGFDRGPLKMLPFAVSKRIEIELDIAAPVQS